MKNLILTALLLIMVFSLTACTPSAGLEEEAPATESIPQAHNPSFTGILEDKKDFMIVVTGDAGDTYAFNLGGLECTAQVGDRVTVTYNGDINDFDAQLLAVKITVED